MLTIKSKLVTTEEDKKILLKTMEVFNDACNTVSEIAFSTKTYNSIELHKKTYYSIRERYNMSSQMTIHVIDKVANTYSNTKARRANKPHTFKPHGSISYDDRNITINGENISINTINVKRLKIKHMSAEILSKHSLRGHKKLQYDKIKKAFYISVLAEDPKDAENTLTITPVKYIGVDLGSINIVVDSLGEFYTGEQLENYRIRITSLKSRLQSTGTKSSKRHLIKLCKREGLHKKDVNHCISKKIVLKAIAHGKALSLDFNHGVGIKLENLKFKTKKTVIKKNNVGINLGKWAFGQLRDFTEYKAKKYRVVFELVNPAYTSQKCSQCDYTDKENRKTQSDFVCLSCGFKIHADYNAAINISMAPPIDRKPIRTKNKRNTRVAVSLPIVDTGVSSELQALPFTAE